MRAMFKRRTRVRAATTVEYALILVAILLVCAGSWKLLGGKLGARSTQAGEVVSNESAGGGASGANGGNPTVASKVSVASGTGGDGTFKARDTANDAARQNAPAVANAAGSDVSDNFAGKRWTGLGLLSAGVIAIAYLLTSLRRAKNAVDAAGGGKAGAARRRRA